MEGYTQKNNCQVVFLTSPVPYEIDFIPNNKAMGLTDMCVQWNITIKNNPFELYKSKTTSRRNILFYNKSGNIDVQFCANLNCNVALLSR